MIEKNQNKFLFWVVILVSQSRKSLARLGPKCLASRETIEVRDFSHTIAVSNLVIINITVQRLVLVWVLV